MGSPRSSDEIAQLTFDSGPSGPSSRFPAPVGPKSEMQACLGGAVVSLFVSSFRQHFLVRPFARRDRIFRIDTNIWPAACVDTDPMSCR
jgi:hypothetical protein